MNLVVTGGAGFVGSHLVEFLIKQNQTVTVLDNLKNGNMDNLKNVRKEIEFHNADILNYASLQKILSKCEGVFHHAALTSVNDSFEKPGEYHEVNVFGTENILKLAKEYGFKVIFASSASVYGNPEKIPIKENAIRRPLNPYGKTKVESENLASKYAKMGVSVVVLRYFNIYGIRQNPAYAGVISKFLGSIRSKKPIMIHGDGQQVRDFVYVEDVINANFLAMKSKINHAIVNVGSGIPISINELANLIVDISGLKVKLLYDDAQKGDIRSSQANISFAKKMLRWKPQTNLENWLQSMIKDNAELL
jgi:nucleoside-diphosphate-sugar epimerase